MKYLLFLSFLVIVSSAKATNYYFSSISGNDDRSPAEAKNRSTPWKTIDKLNSYFTNLEPGDSILFKRGETFYGSIVVSKSGVSNSPIVISGYGTGSKPVITSLVTLHNWIPIGNGISESSDPALSATLNMVLLNATEQEMGRYPNSNAPDNGYLIYESHVDKTSITDNELTSAINWTGAELVIRPRRWILNRNLITAHSGNEISYITSSTYEPLDKYGYFIQNSIKTLDRRGEWFYNASAKKLSLYFGSDKPSSYVIQAAALDNLVSSFNFSNITFDNLTIKGSNGSAFNIRNGSGISIKNCDIQFSGENAVTVNGHANFDIENCNISNQNSNGIEIVGGNNATIKNNKILNTALLAGMSPSGENKGIAVYCKLSGSDIEYNEIKNTGYIGIRFNGSDILVKNNFIDSFCVTKDDGGGIYTFTGSAAPDHNRKVIGNIIMNGIGAGKGTDNPAILSVSGIYLDNNASNVEVLDNTVANCNNNGIYFHDASGIIAKNNTLFNNNRQLTMIQDGSKYAVRNNVVTNNSLFSKLQDQVVSYFKSSADDVSLFGKFDSNYYAKPLDDRITVFNSYVKSSGGTVTQNVDLEKWKKKYDKDLTSKSATKQIAAYKLNRLVGANKIANGTFNNNTGGISTAGCTVSLSNPGVLDGGCLQITPSSKKSSIYMKIGDVTAGKKYILKYSAKGSGDDDIALSAFLRQGSSPYKNLTSQQRRPVSDTRSENELIFVPDVSESSASLVFQTDQQSEYFLDNIQLYEADASITNVDDYIRFEYNPTKTNKIITLDGDYADVKNNKYSKSITLAPYTSVILMKQNKK